MALRRGFTLIELLVVIAIIALLLAVIMPALSSAKRQAQGVICLSNLNGLSKCWFLYTNKYDDNVPSANTGVGTNITSWAQAPQDENGNPKTSGSTIEEKINGIKKGVLFPFVGNEKSYHCPGDKRFLKPPAVSGYSGLGGYRSYSIVNGVGGSKGYGTEPHTKAKTIKSPGNKYVFVEEADGRGFNVNSWAINPKTPDSWVDPISIWHVNSSTFGFADGHGEKHKWHQKEVIEMAEKQTFNLTAPGEDTEWTHLNYPYLKLLP